MKNCTYPLCKFLKAMVFAAFVITSIQASAKSAMGQSEHEIIIKGAATIEDSLEQIRLNSSECWSQLKAINAAIEEQFSRFQNHSSPSEEERSLADAKELEARAKSSIILVQLAEANLKRFETIDDELKEMVAAAKNLERSNEASHALATEIDTQTRASLANQDKLARLIEEVSGVSNTGVSERELQGLRKPHAGAIRVDKALKRALQKRSQASELQKLRKIVAQRQNQLAIIQRLAEGNLKIIRMIVISGGAPQERLSSDFDGILGDSTSDPLDLKSLQPGIDAPLLITPGKTRRLKHMSQPLD